MFIRIWRFAVIVLVVTALCIGSVYASDQAITIELKDMTIQDALSTLFAKTGAKYTLDDGAKGSIQDFSAEDAPFEIVLKELLRKCDLSYEVKDSVYVIKPQPVKTAPVLPTKPDNSRDLLLNNKSQQNSPNDSDDVIKVLRDTGIGITNSRPQNSNRSSNGYNSRNVRSRNIRRSSRVNNLSRLESRSRILIAQERVKKAKHITRAKSEKSTDSQKAKSAEKSKRVKKPSI